MLPCPSHSRNVYEDATLSPDTVAGHLSTLLLCCTDYLLPASCKIIKWGLLRQTLTLLYSNCSYSCVKFYKVLIQTACVTLLLLFSSLAQSRKIWQSCVKSLADKLHLLMVTIMVLPVDRSCCSRASKRCCLAASRRCSGSSSSRTCGSPSTAQATCTACRSPALQHKEQKCNKLFRITLVTQHA